VLPDGSRGARNVGLMPGAGRQNCLTIPTASSNFDGVAGDLPGGRWQPVVLPPRGTAPTSRGSKFPSG